MNPTFAPEFTHPSLISFYFRLNHPGNITDLVEHIRRLLDGYENIFRIVELDTDEYKGWSLVDGDTIIGDFGQEYASISFTDTTNHDFIIDFVFTMLDSDTYSLETVTNKGYATRSKRVDGQTATLDDHFELAFLDIS